MALFTDADLADMRAFALETMPETVAVWRPVVTRDETGAPLVSSYTTVVTTVGRIKADASQPKELLAAERWQTVVGWVVTLPYDADVRAADVLVIGGTRPLEVVAPLGPRSFEVARRVICREVS